jgi:hexulose-6-phosphate isomerase
MNAPLGRRQFIHAASAACATTALGMRGLAAMPLQASTGEHRGQIYKSVKFGMVGGKLSIQQKFELLKELGYDGVELNSPGGCNKKQALAASKAVGLPIHGVVDSIHWGTRLSDPRPEVREKGRAGLETAVRDTHLVGGTSVLLVPGRVANKEKENQEQVWERSIEQISKVLPLCSRLGIHILIENVWNGFCYVHGGPDNQTADKLAEYLDAMNSPWVGAYFDIGNHQRYGKPAGWIRTLGRRIVKLDVKDWGKKNGFCKIGDGDVDWADVRKALKEIGFSGWATAEVGGGGKERLKEIAERMDRALGL